MASEVIPVDRSRAIRRPVGITVTIFNRSAVSVFYDTDPNRMNRSLTGTALEGIEIPPSTQAQIASNPGIFYMRAAGTAPVVVDVEP